MTNEEIENRIRALVPRERKITSEILELIHLAEQRKLYLRRGFSSSFNWLVKEFGYSQPAAYRRIQASRLLSEIPNLGSKLEQGTLNLSLVLQAQEAVRKEEKRRGTKVETAEKTALLNDIENQTADSAQKIIKARFPEIRLGLDTLRRLNESESRLSAILDNNCVENLRRSKEMLSHLSPDGGWGEILALVLNFYVSDRDPLQRNLTHPVTATVNHRVITPRLRAQVLQRAGGQCEFRDENSQRRCESRFQLEVDHIHPRALGGGHELTNLRALCRPHNLFEAERIFGPR